MHKISFNPWKFNINTNDQYELNLSTYLTKLEIDNYD